MAETGNGVARTAARSNFVTAAKRLSAGASVELVRIDDARRASALAHFDSHDDKQWGLIDCASFVVMREREVRRAFTSDRHFVQARFEALL